MSELKPTTKAEREHWRESAAIMRRNRLRAQFGSLTVSRLVADIDRRDNLLRRVVEAESMDEMIQIQKDAYRELESDARKELGGTQ